MIDYATYVEEARTLSERTIKLLGSDRALAFELKSELGDVYLTTRTTLLGQRASLHIMFSASYSVPVLYFQLYEPNGQPLSVSRVVQLLQSQAPHAVDFSLLSPADHPLLGVPFNFVHPCHTADVMRRAALPAASCNYLLRWLTLFGPFVGLHVDVCDLAAL